MHLVVHLAAGPEHALDALALLLALRASTGELYVHPAFDPDDPPGAVLWRAEVWPEAGGFTVALHDSFHDEFDRLHLPEAALPPHPLDGPRAAWRARWAALGVAVRCDTLEAWDVDPERAEDVLERLIDARPQAGELYLTEGPHDADPWAVNRVSLAADEVGGLVVDARYSTNDTALRLVLDEADLARRTDE